MNRTFLISILFVFLPFHSIFIANLFPEFKLWKELIVLLIIIWSLFAFKIEKRYLFLVAILMIACMYSSLTASRALNFDGLYLFRAYLLPLILFLCLISSSFSEKRIEKLYKLYIFIACISVFYGLYQVHILGEAFLLDLGLKSGKWSDSQLTFAFYVSNFDLQRMNAGFTGPIACSLYLLSAIILLGQISFSSRYLAGMIHLILAIGLFSTMLRSTLFVYFLILIVSYIEKNNLSKNFVFAIYGSFIFTTIVVFLMINGQIFSLRESFTNLALISNTINLDASTTAHIISYIRGFSLLSESGLFGFGPGIMGPNFVESGGLNIESSLLALCLEQGIIGLILYLILFIYLYFSSAEKSFCRKLIFSIFLVGLLLPLQYYPELNYLVFTLLGFHYKNDSRKNGI